MEFVIKNGTGNGANAKVDVNGRLWVNGVIETEAQEASALGHSFNINTGDITLTSASESSVLYVKNNEDMELVISTVIFLIGNSTGGTGDLVATVLRNPSTGTVVSDESDTEMKSNKNYGSSAILLADAYKGGEGKTITNGDVSFKSRLNGSAKQYSIGTGDIVLPKGASIGIKITPQTSNTSTTLQVALATYLRATHS